MAAGYGAFDRKKFLALDGYDDLFLPGRLEDSDICFRAWRKGMKLYCQPKSVVYHKGAVAFNKKFNASGTLRINHKNSFLFVWKNIHDVGYIFTHIILLPLRLLLALLKGQKEFIQGFFDALPKLKEALNRRTALTSDDLSDKTIFYKV